MYYPNLNMLDFLGNNLLYNVLILLQLQIVQSESIVELQS
jgi:hypothetical protein